MSVPSKDKYPESIVNPNFDALLKRFNHLVEDSPKPEKILAQLNKLKEEATNTFITGHQRGAIHARCNNYLNGTYGSTARSIKVYEKVK